MIPTTVRQVATAVAGQTHGVDDDAVVTRVVTDSRLASAGDLFVAIAGDHHDGHDHAVAAAAAGAVAVLADRPVEAPCIVVPDTVHGLGLLARDVRRRLPACTVVALTGSSGKTSTKDLLGQVLSRLGPTIAPEGSFNNEIGLPATVLRADEDTRHLVLEMGMRGLGHIAYLCGIAAPDVAVVLNVGSAHLSELGTREAIATAKGEIVDALPEGGLAVLNADDPYVRGIASRTTARTVLFGESPRADVRATGVRLDDQARASYTLRHRDSESAVSLRLHGEHHVSNSLAAAAVALGLGMPIDAVGAALSEAVPLSRWRMEVATTPGGVTVVNDAYNANPESVRAALRALVSMAGGRRTWAVLGEMRELGGSSMTEHDAIGRLAVRLDVSRLVVVGEAARPMHLGAAHEGSWGDESAWVPDADAAIAVLAAEVRPGDVVLVKASRAIGLERVAQALLAAPPREDGAS